MTKWPEKEENKSKNIKQTSSVGTELVTPYFVANLSFPFHSVLLNNLVYFFFYVTSHISLTVFLPEISTSSKRAFWCNVYLSS